MTEKIYQDATNIHRFKVWRSIICNGNKRQYAKELLALYAPARRVC